KQADSGWEILVGMAIGGVFGAVAARKVKLTGMPQMVALFNGVGGGAAALVSLAEFHNVAPAPGRLHGDISVSIMLSALIGSISFAGSMVAFAKLQELIQGRPITYPGQQLVNGLVFAAAVAAGIAIAAGGDEQWLMWGLLAFASVFGVLFVLPLGERRGRRRHARLRPQGHLRPRVRPRGRAGAARRSAARGPARREGRRGLVRDPPGRRSDARAHERPPRRGQRPVPAAEGDG